MSLCNCPRNVIFDLNIWVWRIYAVIATARSNVCANRKIVGRLLQHTIRAQIDLKLVIGTAGEFPKLPSISYEVGKFVWLIKIPRFRKKALPLLIVICESLNGASVIQVFVSNPQSAFAVQARMQ